MGITNMAATIPGFLVPALVGALTHGAVSLLFTYEIINMSQNNTFLAWFGSLAYNLLLDCWTFGSRISNLYTVCIWRSTIVELSRF